jgi:L-lactate utilization protein LutB
MSETRHKSCYGTMFPHGHPRHHQDGKAFRFTAVGPVGMMVQSRIVETDLAEWDDCRACEEFSHCYQLCMARIALETMANHE